MLSVWVGSLSQVVDAYWSCSRRETRRICAGPWNLVQNQIDSIIQPLRRVLSIRENNLDSEDFTLDDGNDHDPESNTRSNPLESMAEVPLSQMDIAGLDDPGVPRHLLYREYNSTIEEMEHYQFQTLDDRSSTEPAHDCVKLLHRSMKEFLLKGNLNVQFPSEDAVGSQKPPGNGHLYILMSSQAWLKLPGNVRRQLRCGWSVALEILYHACQLEAIFPQYDPRILEDIDAEASIRSPHGDRRPEEWYSDYFVRLIPAWVFTFPAFAVGMGLTRYLSHCLSKSHTSADHFLNSKPGRPLLYFAVYMTGEIPRPGMAQFLLSRGANVEARFDDKTAVQSFVLSERKMNGESNLSVITALLKYNADPNSRYYPFRKTSTYGWHPLLHLVCYGSQNIDRSHRLLLLTLLIEHDIDLNAKDAFGRIFLEVLYWNDKRLPGQYWQLLLDKGARSYPRPVTLKLRNPRFVFRNASPVNPSGDSKSIARTTTTNEEVLVMNKIISVLMEISSTILWIRRFGETVSWSAAILMKGGSKVLVGEGSGLFGGWRGWGFLASGDWVLKWCGWGGSFELFWRKVFLLWI